VSEARSVHKQQSVRLILEQSEGWRYVLDYMLTRLKHHEAVLQNPQYADAVRWDACGRRAEMLTLLQALYAMAEIPSPLDTAYVQFLGSIQPPQERQEGMAHDSRQALEAVRRQQEVVREQARRRAAGGLA
jgi:hypothetical protein